MDEGKHMFFRVTQQLSLSAWIPFADRPDLKQTRVSGISVMNWKLVWNLHVLVWHCGR